jgi:nitrite reductase/ring-hydroxylating ferredoxin subunit
VNAFGQKLVVFRGADGAINVLDSYCRHMGGDLSEGQVKGNEIACPFHDWRWGGDGRCKNVPYSRRVPHIVIDVIDLATPGGRYWRGKARIDNPLLVEEDGPVYQLRRWYEQFYVDVDDVTPDMVDRFEFELDTTRPSEAWMKEVEANIAAKAAVAESVGCRGVGGLCGAQRRRAPHRLRRARLVPLVLVAPGIHQQRGAPWRPGGGRRDACSAMTAPERTRPAV